MLYMTKHGTTDCLSCLPQSLLFNSHLSYIRISNYTLCLRIFIKYIHEDLYILTLIYMNKVGQTALGTIKYILLYIIITHRLVGGAAAGWFLEILSVLLSNSLIRVFERWTDSDLNLEFTF